jgi:FkbM family methyltransferase
LALKNVSGVWLPDSDEHFSGHLERERVATGVAGYQTRKWLGALEFCTRRGHALDIGAHVGLWTRPMAQVFGKVTAFEPMPELAACWLANTATLRNVELRQVALGAVDGTIGLVNAIENSGNAHVASGDQVADFMVSVTPLDEQPLDPVDFIKIDVEGFEHAVVRGGERTIRDNRPVMVVEQKPGNGRRYGLSDTAAIDLLTGWGARIAWVRAGDYCLIWDEGK